jgi:biotin carboxylase
MGILTFVTDLNIKAPGCLEADYSAAASTFDFEATAAAAEKFQKNNSVRIDGLLVTGTDQPVLTAARAASRLKIPYFLDEDRALLVTNKKAMKMTLARSGAPVLPGRFIKPGFPEKTLQDLKFPVVVKPLDSQGQGGVYRLESVDAVRARIDEVMGFSRCNEILAEEYYHSDEITLSGWLRSGRLYILSVTDRVTVENPPSIGVCIAHHYPSKYSHRMPEIKKLTEKIINLFELSDGPVYFQYLLGAAGMIINETACRLGGAYEDEFIPFITGIDILELMIKLSCRITLDDKLSEHLNTGTSNELVSGRVVSLQMFFCSEGTISRLSGMEDVLEIPEVSGGSFLQQPGTVIKNRLNSTQRAGYFIVCSETRAQADMIVKKAYSMLKIEDEKGHNMIQFYDKMLFGGNE